MIKAILLAVVLLCTEQVCVPETFQLPIVEQEVDFISVAHLPDNVQLLFFWDRIQGEMATLDYRWMPSDYALEMVDDFWYLGWEDWNGGAQCYRVIKTKHWVESWESESPLNPIQQRPWFAQILFVGLKKPPQQ